MLITDECLVMKDDGGCFEFVAQKHSDLEPDCTVLTPKWNSTLECRWGRTTEMKPIQRLRNYAIASIIALLVLPSSASSLTQEPLRTSRAQEQKPAISLQDYVGRYQADPTMVENFILDVFVEKDQLCIKPSHSPKSQLAAKSADNFVITAVNGPITFNRDAKGLVESLTFEQVPTSGTKKLVAKKLTLPSPSLKGNTTFRLRGHPNARVVALAGSFNDWNQSQVLCGKEGKEGDEWVCRIDLAPGKYTYKFIIDGDWILDPANPDTEDDERGITNSVLTVK